MSKYPDFMTSVEDWLIDGADDFGSACPDNWEEIASFLNDIIEEKLEGLDLETRADRLEARSIVDNLWEDYFRGDIPGAPEPEFE